MENHLTAYSETTFTEGVRDVFIHDGSVHVLGNDGKVRTEICAIRTYPLMKSIHFAHHLSSASPFYLYVMKLFRLEEKSTSQKLDLLFSRSLYPIAIGLAQSEGLDAEEVATINKQYADHLYAKGEFESATKSYVKTLGWVQPSYVIRKVRRFSRDGTLFLYVSDQLLVPY